MKKEITPATAIVIVLIVLAVIAGVYFAISGSKTVTEAPPPSGAPGMGAPAGAPVAPAPSGQ